MIVDKIFATSYNPVTEEHTAKILRIAPLISLQKNHWLDFKVEKEKDSLKLSSPLRVKDGARTRDIRNHNPTLYQLSYNHHVFQLRGQR